MTRTYDAGALVQLPRMDVATAVAVGAEVLAAAAKEKQAGTWEAALEKPLDRVAQSHRTLQDAHVAQAPQRNEDSEEARTADREEDGGFGGINLILQGHLRFPLFPDKRAAAQVLMDALFPNGLDFTQIAYHREWAEGDTRLKRLEQPALQAAVQLLGLQAHHQALKTIHAKYGKALGITDPNAPDAPAPNLREPLDALAEDLRDWVLKVAASVDRDIPATSDRARRLLAPIESLKARQTAPPAKTVDEPVPA